MLGAGPIVRISPNKYSIDDPDAARVIYRTRDELVKVPQCTHSSMISMRLLIIVWGNAPPARDCRTWNE